MKVIKNLWAGYDNYFLPLLANNSTTKGISVAYINNKWVWHIAFFYTSDLKDKEHFPIVCEINFAKMIINEIKKALKEDVNNA